MTNSNAMTNYFIIGGLLVVPFIGWLLVKEQFTGGDSDASLSPDKQRELGINGYNEVRTSLAIQAGGSKRRRKTKRHRHYKTQSVRNKK